MFINKLNQLYKPRRVLYYVDADETVVKDFYSEKICNNVDRYTNAFGTYDRPGVFYIASLAKELGFICLAEGAETKGQIDELRSLGCDVVQGYYFSRPIPVEDYENKYLN